MILYACVIVCGAFLTAGSVAFFFKQPFLHTLAWTWLAIGIIMLIDAFIATLVRLLPNKVADPTKKIFYVSTREKAFYERLKIRKWKDLIPEIGHFTGFRKNTLAEPKNPVYVQRFLLENCYGELGHFFSMLLGFCLLLFHSLFRFWLPISLCVAFVNAILNVLPIFVLRYNFYKLKILHQNLLRKSMRE